MSRIVTANIAVAKAAKSAAAATSTDAATAKATAKVARKVMGGTTTMTERRRAFATLFLLCSAPLVAAVGGCAVVTVADAVVSVAATTVKVGATVVETTVDVAASGVKAVAGSGDKKP